MREVSLERNTNETQIELTLNLDGAGRYQVDTGCGFLNHMLELFARHGRFGVCPGAGRDARHLPLRQLLSAHG